MLAGFGIGLLSSCTYWFLYYWLLAPMAPLTIAAMFALMSGGWRRYHRQFGQLAQGALLSSLFVVVSVTTAATMVLN